MHGTQVVAIALSTVNFSHLHYNIIWRVCDAISGYFVASVQNCLTSTLNYIVMQMRKTNLEKGNFLLCMIMKVCVYINNL